MQIVHELRDGAMEAAHHSAQLISSAQVTERVVMIVHQRRHPRDESVRAGGEFETLPENTYRGRIGECGELVRASRGDK